MFRTYQSQRAGFSLVELLVVLSVVAILAGVIYASFGDARTIARDAERQANIRLVESALELYRQKYDRYPEACNGPLNWSGQPGADYACSGDDLEYIVGLWPEFIQALPLDQRLNGSDSGYVYMVNSDGSVYKFMALNTVENEVLSNDEPHPFFRCGPNFDVDVLSGEDVSSIAAYNASPSERDGELCERTPTGTGGTSLTVYAACTSPSQYETTYAVSAGFSTEDIRSERRIEYYTERVRCQ